MKEIKVVTDCNVITVKEYDDGIANGVQIFFGDNIIAMVDCYRKATKSFPKEMEFKLSEFEQEFPLEGQVGDAISNRTGFCHQSFKYVISGDKVKVSDIIWDEDIPEARLLVYGLEGPDFDEPNEVIPFPYMQECLIKKSRFGFYCCRQLN